MGKRVQKPRPASASSIVVGALIGIFWVTSYWADLYFTEDSQLGSPTPADIGMAIPCVVFSVVITFGVERLFRALDHRALERTGSEHAHKRGIVAGFPSLRDRKVLKGAFALVLAWFPYLVMRFPGNLDADTITQLVQTAGLAPLSDHHPWFDSLIFGAFWKIGDVLGSHAWGLVVYVLFQMVLTAWCLSWSLAYAEHAWGIPHGFCRVLRIFTAVFPFIGMSVTTMSKDTFFGWLYVGFLVLFFEAVRTRGDALKNIRMLVALTVSTLLMAFAKKTGVYIALGALVVLALWSRGNRLRACLPVAVTILVYSILWSKVILGVWNVKSGAKSEAVSVPVQQIARAVDSHLDELDDEDLRLLNTFFNDPNELAEAYVPTRADAARANLKSDIGLKNLPDFLRLYARLGVKYPASYFLGWYGTTYQLLGPSVRWQTFWSDVYYSRESPLFYIDGIHQDVGLYGAIAQDASKSDDPTVGERFMAYMEGCVHPEFAQFTASMLDRAYLMLVAAVPYPFSKAPYAFWIPLLVTMYAVRRRSWSTLICTAPIWLSLLSLMLGPISLPRYMVSMVYAAPISLCLLFAPHHACTADGTHEDDGEDAVFDVGDVSATAASATGTSATTRNT